MPKVEDWAAGKRISQVLKNTRFKNVDYFSLRGV